MTHVTQEDLKLKPLEFDEEELEIIHKTLITFAYSNFYEISRIDHKIIKYLEEIRTRREEAIKLASKSGD